MGERGAPSRPKYDTAQRGGEGARGGRGEICGHHKREDMGGLQDLWVSAGDIFHRRRILPPPPPVWVVDAGMLIILMLITFIGPRRSLDVCVCTSSERIAPHSSLCQRHGLAGGNIYS